MTHIFNSAICRALAVAAAAFLLGTAAQAATVVQWTFETNTPTDLPDSATIGSIAADVGTGQASGVHASAATDWTTPAGNGSSNSLSSNEWAIGDYYQFQLSTANFQDIVVMWDQTRSGTGPATFDFAYSLNGTDFTVFGDNYAVEQVTWASGAANPLSTQTADLSAVAALDNVGTVFFRLIADSAPGGTAGTNRVDNFTVSGETFVPPAQPLYWDANGVAPNSGGTGTWSSSSLTWSTNPAGNTSLQAFDSAKAAVFNATPGTVTVAPEGVAANAGLRFEVSGYRIEGGAITLGGSFPSISVMNAADTATINAPIAGNAGLVKTGAGTLELGAVANSFTGNVNIAAGRLSIGNDEQLGAAENDLVFTGGILKIRATSTLAATRALNGSGALEVPPSETLTIAGPVSFSATSLRDAGTVKITNATAATLGSLTLEASGTLEITGPAAAATTITANGVAGTARIIGPLNLGTQTRSVTVADGAAATDLQMTGPIALSGAGSKLQKLGAGSLELSGANTELSGVRQGIAGNLPTDGGIIRINNKDALGNGDYQFNAGTLQVLTDLVGVTALPAGVNLSIGASTTAPAIFTGSALEVTGTTSLFRPTNASIQHQMTVNNNLVLTGSFAESTGTGTTSGLTIAGSGGVTLANAVNPITDPISIESPSVVVNGSLSAAAVAVKNGGSLRGSGSFAGTVSIGDGTSTGTLSPGQDIGTMTVAALTLESDATFRFEMNTPAQLFDLLIANGAVSLGSGVATLLVTDSNSVKLTLGTELRLIDNQSGQSTSGTFENYPDLAPFTIGQNTFEIDYGAGTNSNDVVLRVIPEPSAALLVGCGWFWVMNRRRRWAF